MVYLIITGALIFKVICSIFCFIWFIVYPLIIAFRIFTNSYMGIADKIGWLIFDFIMPPIGSIVYALKYEGGWLWKFAYIARIFFFIGLGLLVILFITGHIVGG